MGTLFLALPCLMSFLTIAQIGIPGVLLICIGIPLSCFVWLWSHRHMLEEEGFLANWGFLYEVRQGSCKQLTVYQSQHTKMP